MDAVDICYGPANAFRDHRCTHLQLQFKAQISLFQWDSHRQNVVGWLANFKPTSAQRFCAAALSIFAFFYSPLFTWMPNGLGVTSVSGRFCREWSVGWLVCAGTQRFIYEAGACGLLHQMGWSNRGARTRRRYGSTARSPAAGIGLRRDECVHLLISVCECAGDRLIFHRKNSRLFSSIVWNFLSSILTIRVFFYLFQRERECRWSGQTKPILSDLEPQSWSRPVTCQPYLRQHRK